MKVKIYFDPFKKTQFDQIVEILEIVEVPKNPKTDSEIACYHLFKSHGLKKATVKYSDGTIVDNTFFDPNDILNTYRFNIVARKVGAIGITYPISAKVEAENEKAAILALYETYDQIQIKTINSKPYKYK